MLPSSDLGWLVKEASFSVGYGGPGVEDGRMGVRQLAPALLAIGGLIEESNRTVNGESAHVNVRIRPSTRRGSAIIELAMQFGLAEQLGAFVDATQITDAQHLLALLGFIDPEGQIVGRINSLLEFIKAVGGNEVKSITNQEDGTSQVAVKNNEGDIVTYNVNNTVLALGNSSEVRENLADIIGPLNDPTIDEFQVWDPEGEGRVLDRVTKEEADKFTSSPPMDDEESQSVEEGEFTDWVTVRKSWAVKRDRKWQFEGSSGQPFNATITDEDFWEQMQKDLIAPTPHAKFYVKVKWTQKGDEDPDHTVTEVMDYVPAPPQQSESFDLDADLDLDDEDFDQEGPETESEGGVT